MPDEIIHASPNCACGINGSGERFVDPICTDTRPTPIPGWEGTIGPGPGQYGDPHVYARSIHSGAGNCVCGRGLGDAKHVHAAPGVPIPDEMRAT